MVLAAEIRLRDRDLPSKFKNLRPFNEGEEYSPTVLFYPT